MKCYNDVTSVKDEPVDWIESDSHFEEEIFGSEKFNYNTKPKRRYIKRKITMHPLESGAGIPAFLAKLWRLVEDSETNNLISWSQDGKSFTIQNQAKFAKELLPLNYKHNNMASFIRQLNMYGFHKITSIDNGGLKFDKDEMEFSHPYFQKGHPYLIEHIKRKIANPKQPEADKTAVTKSETMNRVLSEVKNMRGRQDSLDNRFSTMKQENEALWREVAMLRQKHMKQQQIVNKLIQFLVTIVNPQRSGLGSGIGKRRYHHLMINDAPQSKVKKTMEGPVISELTEELLEDIESDLDADGMNLSANIQSPGSQYSSKGSKSCSGLDDFYFITSPNDDNLMKLDDDPFTNESNIGNAFFPDAADDLDMDDIDEIDTNNMAIYSGTSSRKKDRSKFIEESTSSAPAKSAEAKSVVVPQKGKSLLVKSAGKTLPEIQISVPNVDDNATGIDGSDVLAQAISSAEISPNSLNGQSIISNYDETSRHTDKELGLDEELLTFENKVDNIKQEVDNTSLLKYNPTHEDDILGLSSPTDYTNHINNVQNDLDSLKDLLHNDSYQLDTNQLLGTNQSSMNFPMYSIPSIDAETISKLFDDNLYEMSPSSMDLFTTDNKKLTGEGTSSTGSELISYQPSPFNNNLDLNDLLANESIEQGETSA